MPSRKDFEWELKKSKGKRGLSDGFMKDLSEGILSPVLEAVKNDNTLILEIRDDYIDIYYRGGRLLELKPDGSGYLVENTYSEYIKNLRQQRHLQFLPKETIIASKENACTWADCFYVIKAIMDDYFAKNLKLEKEFQQLVVRENNILKEANYTDYFIIDFEYQNEHTRFDLVALRWDSTTKDRRKPENCLVSIIEVKYGDNSLKGKSGLIEHIKDAEEFLSEKKKVDEFKNEMLFIFNQKRELGLINFGKNDNTNLVSSIKDDCKIEFVLLLATHKPESNILKGEVQKISEMKNADLKFADASFMGYGLYSKLMLNLQCQQVKGIGR